MGKQHETFLGEKPDFDQPKETPETNQPAEPVTPELPQEDPQIVPDEYPPDNNSSEAPQQPGIL